MTMVSLKKPSANEKQGNVVIVRPSKLAEAGTTGTVAEGVFEGTKPNKFNADKSDYFIRGADNTLYILNETTGLKEQLGQPGLEGLQVRVQYNGLMTSKRKGGKSKHDFEVFADKAD